MSEKEFERKSLLSEAEYLSLQATLKPYICKETYFQENRYYDTPDFALAASHSTLRVRSVGGRCERQYKHSQTVSGDIRSAIEDNCAIDGFPPFFRGSDFPDRSSDEIFVPLGSLFTERTDYRIGDALISLDKSSYFGTTDFEVEIETPDTSTPLPRTVLDWNLNFSRPVSGKYHRFLQEFKKHNCQ